MKYCLGMRHCVRLLAIACLLFSSSTTYAQRNVFVFDTAQVFKQASYKTHVYRVPPDSVQTYIYQNKPFNPTVSWMQEPFAIFATDSTEIYLNGADIPSGYYVLVNAYENKVQSTLRHKPGFNIVHTAAGDKHILAVESFSGEVIRNAIVKLNNKLVKYNEGMRGYVFEDFEHEEKISVRYGTDVTFYNTYLYRNADYEGKKKRNEVREMSEAYNQFNGYLVTNKPMYLPGDTVKWKAYLENTRDKFRLSRERLHISFSDNYDRKEVIVSKAFEPEEPGVYFGEFVLGDSIKVDRDYTLKIYGTRTALRLQQTFRVEDYLLNELRLSVKGERVSKYQHGDSVKLYAFAYNSNNLPVGDGTITITVKTANYKQDAIKQIFLPDTLYHAMIPVSTDGETDLSFSTKDFPTILLSAKVDVSLVNANFDRRDTSFQLVFTDEPKYFRITQKGNKVLAELVSNKKPARGQGTMIVTGGNSRRIPQEINFPYEYTVGAYDNHLQFTLTDDTGKSIITEGLSIQNASLDGIEDFRGDTAMITLINPHHVLYRYSVYVGDDYSGFFFTDRDTLLKFISKKGKTVTLIGSYVWLGQTVNKQFAIVKMDRNMVIDVTKKDLVYPGQQDTIQIALRNRDGDAIGKTNVTVLAYNSQFERDNIPEMPYGGSLYPPYSLKRMTNLTLQNIVRSQSNTADKLWLKRCGADTIFFYKNLYLLPDDVAFVNTKILTAEMPQLGIYLQQGHQYIQPEVIYGDNKSIYIRRAVSTDPQAISIPAGIRSIAIRTADALITIPQLELCEGFKTDLYLNLDSVGPFYRKDTVGDTIKVYRTDHLRSFVSKTVMPTTFQNQEKDALANRLLMYYDREGLGSSVSDQDRIAIFQQHPRQYNISMQTAYSKSAAYPILIGPINFDYTVHFFQENNMNFKFEPEKNFVFSFKPGMTRVEAKSVYDLLNYNLYNNVFWPSEFAITSPLDVMDSLEVHPVIPTDKPQQQYIKTDELEEFKTQYWLAETGNIFSGTARLLVAPKDSGIRYLIARNLKALDTIMIISKNGHQYPFIDQLKPGDYELTFVFNDDHYRVFKRISLKEHGVNVLPVSYKEQEGKLVYTKPPVLLKKFVMKNGLPANHMLHGYRHGKNTTGIAGVLTDLRGEPLISAKVSVSQGNINRDQTLTNYDGEFMTKNLGSGMYDVTFTWQNFQQTIINVKVERGSVAIVNLKLNTTNDLSKGKELIIRAARRNVPPLVDAKSPNRNSITSERLEKMASTNVSDVASLSSYSYQSRSGANVQLGGARAANTQYVIDGMVISGGGNINPTMGSIDAISTYTSGIPAKYGDADGGVVGSGKYLSSNKAKDFMSNFINNMMVASGLRKDFRDWAIWEPNLWTNTEGNTSFSVQYPSNLTSWKTYVLAMNRDGYSGKAVRITRAFKPLGASLSTPRFLRYGDTVEVIGKAMNYTDSAFRLKSSFLRDTIQTNMDTMSLHHTRVLPFKVAAPVPNVVDSTELTIGYSITAENGYTDGEIRTIPVLPVGVNETKGQTYLLTGDSTFTCSPDRAQGYFTGKAKVYVDGSMLEVMLREVEQLKVYPHGCTEQLTTKLLSIYYEEAIKKALGRKDFNNTKAKREILEKLTRAQNTNGSFGWWSGNHADYRITNYVLSTMQKMNDDGWLDFILRRGMSFLSSSLYDMPLQDQITSMTTLSRTQYASNYKPVLDKIDTLKLSTYDHFAVVKIKKQLGINYRKDLDSLVAKKEESVNGCYWNATAYDWYRDDLAATLLAYQVIKGDSVYGGLTEGILKHILFRRQNGQYQNTAASGLVLTTILPDLLSQKSLGSRNTKTYVKLSGAIKDSTTSFPKIYATRNFGGELKVEKKGMSPAYVSVVYDYFNPKPVAHDKDFEVKTYFLNAKQDSVTELKAGEKITLRVIVNCKKTADYVMIEVPIPAGCVQAKMNGSPYRYGEAARENFKDQTYIFCNSLGKNVYTFDVELEARYKGSFNLSPAKAGMMYYPEEYGNTEVKRVKID